MNRRPPRDASTPLPPGKAPPDKLRRLRQHRHDAAVTKAKRARGRAAAAARAPAAGGEGRASHTSKPHKGTPIDRPGFIRWWKSMESEGLLSVVTETEMEVVRDEAWRAYHNLAPPSIWRARRMELQARKRAADELHDPGNFTRREPSRGPSGGW